MQSEGDRMTDFTVNVVSEKDDKRIPVGLAGQVMVDIQDLFRHIGEYLVARELRLQGPVSGKLSEKFTIFLDKSGGIVLESSTERPETQGYGNIVEEAVAMLETVLDTMGAGTGGYWLDDNFRDAIYRNQIAIDVVALHQDLYDREGYALMYGSGADLKRFGKVDVDKMANFLRNRGLSVNSVTIGVIENGGNRSRNNRYLLNTGNDSVRLSFADQRIADTAPSGACVVAGRINYSEEGRIASVDSVTEVAPISSIMFRRMISAAGDVILRNPLSADVAFENGKWIVSNSDLGIKASNASWDGAVSEFHDYFVFLWSEYADKDGDSLLDEEREIRDYLLKLIS